MRKLFFTAAAATMLLMSAVAPALSAQIRLKVGEIFDISNAENGSTGYIWAIDADASHALDLLRIDDKGTEPIAGAEGRVGAPMQHGWIVHASAPGEAKLVLVHKRPWERAGGRRQSYTFLITP